MVTSTGSPARIETKENKETATRCTQSTQIAMLPGTLKQLNPVKAFAICTTLWSNEIMKSLTIAARTVRQADN